MAKLNPITRKEKYLAKAGGQSVTVPLPPITREEQFLKDIIDAIESGGSSSDYATSLSLTIDSDTYVVTAQLLNKDGQALGDPQVIDLPPMVVGATYDNTTKTLILTLKNGQTVNVPIGAIVSGLLPDKGDHTTINGVDFYVSATQPTGTIPEGSIGIGW